MTKYSVYCEMRAQQIELIMGFFFSNLIDYLVDVVAAWILQMAPKDYESNRFATIPD